MAACYDAVKAVDPKITVIAFGLSPRGNDDFEASEQRLALTDPLSGGGR